MICSCQPRAPFRWCRKKVALPSPLPAVTRGGTSETK
jgi:hypothetical protein